MTDEHGAIPDAERVLALLEPVMEAESLEAAAGEVVRQLGSFTQAFATALYLTERGAIMREAWHPKDDVRRARLGPHFRGLVMQTAREGAPVVVPFPAHIATGLVPHLFLLRAKNRLLGVLCFACLRESEQAPCGAESVIERLAGLVAQKLASLQATAGDRSMSAHYQRWFRQLDQHIQVLDRERQKFAALANRTDTRVLLTDPNGIIRWINRRMLEGIPAPPEGSSWVGRPCCELCKRVGAAGETACRECPVDRALKSNHPMHREVRFPGPDGERRLQATALPIKDLKGHTEEVILLLQDLEPRVAA